MDNQSRTTMHDGVSSIQSLVQCFESVEDPRVDRTKHHLLIDIMVIAMLAVIANSDKWSDIRIWAEISDRFPRLVAWNAERSSWCRGD